MLSLVSKSIKNNLKMHISANLTNFQSMLILSGTSKLLTLEQIL